MDLQEEDRRTRRLETDGRSRRSHWLEDRMGGEATGGLWIISISPFCGVEVMWYDVQDGG